MAMADVKTTEFLSPFLGVRTVPVASGSGSDAIYRARANDFVDRFNRLVYEWRIETMFKSQIKDKMENPVFRQIIDMGEPIIPLIISELKHKYDFLFLALHAITKENPVPVSARGRIPEIIDAWLAWAARRGHDV